LKLIIDNIEMARTVDVIVETGKDGFSCFMSKDSDDLKFGLVGSGRTVRLAIEDFYVSREEVKEVFEDKGQEFPDLEFRFIFDVGAYLNYYPINVTAFAHYIGMNASLLRQYATGIKTPQAKNLEKIRQGIIQVGHDIADGLLIDRPVLQYV